MNIAWVLALAFVCGAVLVMLILNAPWGVLRFKRRLRDIADPSAASRPKKVSTDPFPTISKMLQRRGYLDPLTRRLARAGADLRASEFVALNALSAAVPMLLVWLLSRSALLALAALIAGGIAPMLGLMISEHRRLMKFERQLPDGLMLIASSLRSGYGFMRAVQVLTQEMAPPISTEFKKTLEEVNLGIETEEALRHMTERIPSYDLDITVSAMGVQLQVGGNLAQLLETVAETIRERQRIRAEIKTLTAEARLSGVILFMLPIVMLVVVNMLNPGYIGPLIRTDFGHILVAAGFVLQVIGGLVIWRMLQLEL
jgi:tight adherence protein B